MHRTMILAAAAAASLLPAAAVAQSAEPEVIVTGDRSIETRSIAVSIGDLDLRSDKAVRIADARVDLNSAISTVRAG